VDFFSVNSDIWGLVGVDSQIYDHARRIDFVYKKLISQFKAAIATGSDVGGTLGSAILKVSPLGLHAFMFHDREFLERALKAPHAKPYEHMLANSLRLSIRDLRECLWHVFETYALRPLVSFTDDEGEDIAGECNRYRRLGLAVAHIGFIIRENPGLMGSPGGVSYTALTPWILATIYAMAEGSIGAGSIATIGAPVGRGKTTTLYYVLRSVLNVLGHPEPDSAASKLIFIDPFKFVDVAQELINRGEKAAILVVDNASALFPKHWVRLGGGWSRFYTHMNILINMIRSLSAVTIFVANNPGELSSFVRNAATTNIAGAEADIKPFTATIFTWKAAKLRVSQREEELVKREKLASVYVYPLLKMPNNLYKHDLEVKMEVNRRELAQALQALKEELARGEPPAPH